MKKFPYAARLNLTDFEESSHFPENGMPEKSVMVAIREMVNCDSRPSHNLASFVTTFMPDSANQLIQSTLNINLADRDEYPHTMKLEENCVDALSEIFHGPEKGVGTSTVGSSEAMMLAGLAMKRKWQLKNPKSTKKPNLVMGSNVQVCWEKFANYFDVEPRYVPMQEDSYVIHPEAVRELIDDATIGVCVIIGTTYTGQFEPLKSVAKMLDDYEKETGHSIPIHLDGASGGLIAAFLYPEKKLDFRNKRVVSINISGHKYGLVYPGCGWVIWGDQSYLPEDLIFYVNYLGGNHPTFNLNFSRPAAFMIAQYFNFISLGRSGYHNVFKTLQYVAHNLAEKIASHGDFNILSDKEGVPLVVWEVKENAGYTVYQVSDELRKYRWVVPAYKMPTGCSKDVLRVVVRESFSLEVMDGFYNDLMRAIHTLKGRSTDESQNKASVRC